MKYYIVWLFLALSTLIIQNTAHAGFLFEPGIGYNQGRQDLAACLSVSFPI